MKFIYSLLAFLFVFNTNCYSQEITAPDCPQEKVVENQPFIS